MPRTNKILIRSGTVAPTASDFAVGEPAFDKSAGKLYIKNAAGAMVELGTGGSGGSVDVYEYATTANFPATGVAAVIYVATDTGRTYRWAGTAYMELGSVGGGGSLSASVTIPASGDQYWDSTVLLLKGDGTTGDSSSFARTVTNYGAAATGTAKFGSNSLSFSGASSYLRVTGNSAFSLPGDFAIEAWVYFDAAPSSFAGAYGACIMATYPAGSGGWQLRINGTSTSYTTINLYTGITDLNWNGTFAINQWHHVAVTRSGSSVKAFIDGVQAGSTATCSDNMDSYSGDVWVGRLNASPYFFQLNGLLDDVRITKGAARYTAAFTPPAAAAGIGTYVASQTLPVVGTGSIGSGLSWSCVPASPTATGTAGQIAYDNANGFFYLATATDTWKRAALSTWEVDAFASSVVLLMHADGTLVDSSSYGRTVTAVGEANASGSAKFGSTSLTFDGSGDYLTTPSAAILDLGDNYTIECWVYPNSSDLTGGIVHRGIYYASGNGAQSESWGSITASIRALGSSLRFYFYATTNATEQSVDVSQTYFPANAWTHLAMVRSGTSGKVFANGVLVGTISGLNSNASSDQPLIVGTWVYKVSGNDTYAGYWNGRIDELRITRSARYSAAFTPPTAAFPNP